MFNGWWGSRPRAVAVLERFLSFLETIPFIPPEVACSTYWPLISHISNTAWGHWGLLYVERCTVWNCIHCIKPGAKAFICILESLKFHRKANFSRTICSGIPLGMRPLALASRLLSIQYLLETGHWVFYLWRARVPSELLTMQSTKMDLFRYLSWCTSSSHATLLVLYQCRNDLIGEHTL